MRKNFIKILFINIVALIFTTSCTQLSNNQLPAIQGKIIGAQGKKIILEELTVNDLILIDSAIISTADEFSFSAHPEETTFNRLRFEDGNFITIVLSHGEQIEITAKADEFPPDYGVSGNDDSQILQNYFTETHQRQLSFDHLREEFFNSTHLDDFYLIRERIDRELEQLISDQRNFTIQIIEENPGSFASLLLLNQRFTNQVMVDPVANFRLFELTDSALMKKYPQNSHVLEHHRRVSEMRNQIDQKRSLEEKFSPGQPFPDISLNDPTGKTFRISELRGKTVLVYFWVSWSPPCRAANHQLKELYTAWHPKGFEIFAISLDHQQRFWAEAIKVDELPWINVSDLRGMSSPVIELFNLSQELPFYFLVDEEGKIAAKSNKFTEINKAVAEHFRQ